MIYSLSYSNKCNCYSDGFLSGSPSLVLPSHVVSVGPQITYCTPALHYNKLSSFIGELLPCGHLKQSHHYSLLPCPHLALLSDNDDK